MTRINSTIPVRNLTDEHLLAEHREIKRLPSCLYKAISCGTIRNIPEKFKLGKGHVTFFLDKQKYILRRYKEIHAECLRRGFKVKSFESNWNDVPECYMKDYTPSDEEHEMIVERIFERIMHGKKEFYHYCGLRISRMEAAQMVDYPNLRPVVFGK